MAGGAAEEEVVEGGSKEGRCKKKKKKKKTISYSVSVLIPHAFHLERNIYDQEMVILTSPCLLSRWRPPRPPRQRRIRRPSNPQIVYLDGRRSKPLLLDLDHLLRRRRPLRLPRLGPRPPFLLRQQGKRYRPRHVGCLPLDGSARARNSEAGPTWREAPRSRPLDCARRRRRRDPRPSPPRLLRVAGP